MAQRKQSLAKKRPAGSSTILRVTQDLLKLGAVAKQLRKDMDTLIPILKEYDEENALLRRQIRELEAELGRGEN